MKKIVIKILEKEYSV